MEITQVKVHLRNASNSKLKAFVTITFDDQFVVRDLKVIEGKKGLFVAMPSLKKKEPCQSCGKRNATHSRFCSECGARLPEQNRMLSEEERREEHRDIAHPITPEAREYIQGKIMDAYNEAIVEAGHGESSEPDEEHHAYSDSSIEKEAVPDTPVIEEAMSSEEAASEETNEQEHVLDEEEKERE